MQVGQCFDKWTVALVGPRKIGVVCECGKAQTVLRFDLHTGKTRGCLACRGGTNKRGPARGRGNPNWRGGTFMPHAALSQIQANARRRGIPCALTLADLEYVWEAQKGCCALTGIPLELPRKPRAKHKASVDRINNLEGYTRENIRWVVKELNIAKAALVEADFLLLIKQVYEHLDLGARELL